MIDSIFRKLTRKLLYGFIPLTLFLYSGCETEIKPGHFKCDVAMPGSCPDGWICQNRGSDGISRCYPDESGYCGDLILDIGESCDGTNFVDFSCANGWAICGSDCIPYCSSCGNGIIELDMDKRGEECDDGNTVGGDNCSPDCKIEKYCEVNSDDSCTEYCGDSLLNGPEECDNTAIAPWYSCEDFGFYSGDLGCLDDCTVDLSVCEGFCGDGQANGLEVCDGLDSDAVHCVDFSYDGGSLGCSFHCVSNFDCFNYWNREKIGVTGHIYKVWGDGTGKLYAAGSGGTVVYHDSDRWSQLNTGSDSDLRGIWASSTNNIFVAGTNGQFHHFNSGAWSSPTTATTSDFNAVWGSSAVNVLFAGQGGEVYRYNGSLISVESGVPIFGDTIFDIWGLDSEHIYIVGDFPAVISYDGTQWSSDSLPMAMGDVLHGIWGNSWNNLYVAGEKNDDSGFLYHFNGSLWQEVNMGFSNMEGIYSMWGNGDDLYLLGKGGTLYTYTDGSWKAHGNPHGGTFTSIWGTSMDNLYLSGLNGKIIKKLANWEESDYLFEETLNSVTGDTNSVFAVGNGGYVWQYEQNVWTSISSPVTQNLNSITTVFNGGNERKYIAVGDMGTIISFDGTAWTDMGTYDASPNIDLHDVSSFGNQAIAVGGSGAIWFYNGTQWSSENSSQSLCSASLNGVWSDGDSVAIVGDGGVIITRIDSIWSTVNSPVNINLNTVWGSSSSSIYAGGDDGTLLHYNGIEWSLVDTNQGFDIVKIYGISSSHIFALGRFGELLFFNGAQWSPITGIPASTSSLYIKSKKEFFISESAGIWRGMINFPHPYGGLCSDPVKIYCETELHGDSSYGITAFDVYPDCPGVDDLNMGPEQYYKFQSPINGDITILLNGLSNNLDLVVSSSNALSGCEPINQCDAMSHNSGTNPEQIEMSVSKGETLYFIVDSKNSDSSPYTISIQCNPRRPE
jgi:cysteine-rich repeat protein